jgi:hypothetical protein
MSAPSPRSSFRISATRRPGRHAVRRRYPDLPVVLTSGYSHVLAEEGRHGFELLQKLYAAEDLSRVLDRAIRRSRRK